MAVSDQDSALDLNNAYETNELMLQHLMESLQDGLEGDSTEEDRANIPSSSTSPTNGEQEQPSDQRSAQYKQKRAKNNESVKKCRERAKKRSKELEERNQELERENKRLREENHKMSKELTVVRLLFQENNNRSDH